MLATIIANYTMNQLKIIFCAIGFLFISCQPSKNKKLEVEKEKATLKVSPETIKLAINPKFKDWVLFENGTYIIFDNVDTIKDVKAEAIKEMKEFGPVHVGGSAGDFSVTKLTETDGWIVSGHGYGMYTYVSPVELDSQNPSDVDVGLFGRSKRDLDGKNPIVIHINRK